MLALLEKSTGAVGRDVLVSEDGIAFIVKPGDVGKVIGKGGSNIKKLRELLGKTVDVVEDNETVQGFVRNLFTPASITDVTLHEIDGKKSVQVKVDPAQKGLAIGKGGERAKRARRLAKRRFDIDDLKIS